MTVDNITGTDVNPPGADVAAMMEIMKNIMDRITLQDKATKITNECHAEITAVMMPPAFDDNDPIRARRQLFITENPKTRGVDPATNRQITDLHSSMQDINSKIHKMTNSDPEIERVLAATLNPPFTKKITNVMIHQTDKLTVTSFSSDSDPMDYITMISISMGC